MDELFYWEFQQQQHKQTSDETSLTCNMHANCNLAHKSSLT